MRQFITDMLFIEYIYIYIYIYVCVCVCVCVFIDWFFREKA